MGTSAGYDAPPSWGPLKSSVTQAANGGHVTRTKAQQLVRDFVHYNGGATRMARRRGRGGGGGGVVGGGAAARNTANRLGAFISDVGTVGLSEALHGVGLSALDGRPVHEILAGLLDRIGGSASTIDDVDARAALARLQKEYLNDAADAAEVEEILQGQVANLDGLLTEYFGYYLYELFCRVFFERLVQRIGETPAYSFLKQIEDFINSTLANRTSDRDLSKVDWAGAEGQAITADVMETTLEVFGG